MVLGPLPAGGHLPPLTLVAQVQDRVGRIQGMEARGRGRRRGLAIISEVVEARRRMEEEALVEELND